MAKRTAALRTPALTDDRNYSLVGPNGYRKGLVRQADVAASVKRMVEECHQAGWTGTVTVYYLDGSPVSEHPIGANDDG